MGDKREAAAVEQKEDDAASKRQCTGKVARTQASQFLPFLVPRTAEEQRLEDRAVTVKEVYLPRLQEATATDGDWICVGHDVAAGEDLLLQLSDKEWDAVEDLSAVQHGAMLHALQLRLDATLNAWELRVIVRVPLWDDENEERACVLRSLSLPLGPDLTRVRRVPAGGRQLLQRWVRGEVCQGEKLVVDGFIRSYRAMLSSLAELEPLCRCLEGKATQEEVARMAEAVVTHFALLRRLRDMVLRKTNAIRDIRFQ